MIVHEIASAVTEIDILLWDAIEREWRIGHGREVIDGLIHWCACTMREAAEMLADDLPVPVFERVTHWSPLPAPPPA